MSKGADELLQMIKECFGEYTVVIREHVLPGNLRLDYYIPSMQLAFEYHGRQHFEFVSHFHKDSEGFRDSKWRDEKKSELCHKMGIMLVHFNDGEHLSPDLVRARVKGVVDSWVPYVFKEDEYDPKRKEFELKNALKAKRREAYVRSKARKKNLE